MWWKYLQILHSWQLTELSPFCSIVLSNVVEQCFVHRTVRQSPGNEMVKSKTRGQQKVVSGKKNIEWSGCSLHWSARWVKLWRRAWGTHSCSSAGSLSDLDKLLGEWSKTRHRLCLHAQKVCLLATAIPNILEILCPCWPTNRIILPTSAFLQRSSPMKKVRKSAGYQLAPQK